MKEQNVYQILLIEDNPADAHLVKIAFGAVTEFNIEINVLSDSTRLIHYLHGQGEFKGIVIPDLILLDYHHPINGGVALAELAGSPDLRHIPIVVITGSEDPNVVYEAYSRCANCVIQKPGDLDGLIEMARDLAVFWFNKPALPLRRQPSQPTSARL